MDSSFEVKNGGEDYGFAALLESQASKRARTKDVLVQPFGAGQDNDEDLFDNFANRYESILKGHESEIMGGSFGDDDEEEGDKDEQAGEDDREERYTYRAGSDWTDEGNFQRNGAESSADLKGNERLKSRLSRIYQRAGNEVHFPAEAERRGVSWTFDRKGHGGVAVDEAGGWHLSDQDRVGAGPLRTRAWQSHAGVAEKEIGTKRLQKESITKTKKKTTKKKAKKAKKPWKRLAKHKPSLVSETFGTPHEKSTLHGTVSAKEHLALKHKLRKARAEVRELKKNVGELEYAAKQKKKAMVTEREKHKATCKQLEIQEKLMLQVLERFKTIELECRARNDLGLDRREGMRYAASNAHSMVVKQIADTASESIEKTNIAVLLDTVSRVVEQNALEIRREMDLKEERSAELTKNRLQLELVL